MITAFIVLYRFINPVLSIELNPTYQSSLPKQMVFLNSRQPVITERHKVVATDIAITGQVDTAAAGPLPIRVAVRALSCACVGITLAWLP